MLTHINIHICAHGFMFTERRSLLIVFRADVTRFADVTGAAVGHGAGDGSTAVFVFDR